MPDESHLQDAACNLEAGSAERQVNAMFAAIFYAFRKCIGTLGCWPRARPVLQCHGVLVLYFSFLGPEVCQTKATCKTQRAIWKLAVQNGRSRPGLQLFSRHSESDVWHAGLLAAGLIRPSVPCCFGAAAPSLDPRCARRKPPARRSMQFGSWQCRTAS